MHHRTAGLSASALQGLRLLSQVVGNGWGPSALITGTGAGREGGAEGRKKHWEEEESWEPEQQAVPLRRAPWFCRLGGYPSAWLGCRVRPGLYQQGPVQSPPSFLTRVTLVCHLLLLRTRQGGAVRETGGGGESYSTLAFKAYRSFHSSSL